MSAILFLLISIITLFWAANHLITGAMGIAHSYRLPPLLIGLTIVAIGTSSPEIMVGLSAALYGSNDLTLGNAIGSNIANIGLVLGIIIVIRPLVIQSTILRKEYALLYLVMLFTYSLMIDGYLSVLDGTLFLLAAIGVVAYFIYLARHNTVDPYARELRKMIKTNRSIQLNWISVIIGVIVLPISAHYLVINTAKLASSLGVSQLVIGLTVVAIGTSLPQAATSIMAALNGQDDIAIGNILGSNMFNLLLVLAFPAIINPSAISHAILWRDIPIMLGITLVLLLISFKFKKRISRWYGGLLLLIYGSYITALVVNAIVAL
ncbi:Ca2 /Na antiporter (plasmid) [Legionella adelaidensis]|uniref:Ca2 /Na antiporter n=1 Tax=Legionella adelaidensis TaxID=45056 RepID=A0A0W0R1I8_9GAMM|nr:calcium/sodium antiporter [Legionella adelaidensis]KTC64917.1 Na/Ca antiporter [Legionella adelaidensis]VEH85600.1 Ca2 /Na antiporter [Legionella adelaidensis]